MKRLDVFKCAKCGNIVELMHMGGGPLSCCGQPMTLMTENTSEGAHEKHIPVFEDGCVKVGSAPHPMEADHYIEWIEGAAGENLIGTQFLSPGEEPKVDFTKGWATTARAYCNKHGLWKGGE